MKGPAKTNEQGFWRGHSAAWRASGLTQQAYCEQKHISYGSFVYQHNRLISQSNKTPLNFVAAKPEPGVLSSQAAGLQLLLPNGIRIGISAEISPALLQTVLSVAGGIKCCS